MTKCINVEGHLFISNRLMNFWDVTKFVVDKLVTGSHLEDNILVVGTCLVILDPAAVSDIKSAL
jgi:hypothetical protein